MGRLNNITVNDTNHDINDKRIEDADISRWNSKGTYSKPAGGIPASDLATGVVPDVTGKTDKVTNATNGNFAALDASGNLTDSGKKASDFLTQHQDISVKQNSTDNSLTTESKNVVGAINEVNGALSDKYSKPDSGIPSSDMTSAVQTSLALADSALQSHQSLSAYRTASAQDVIDGGKVSTTDYNPDAKTSAMTQSVGKDENGKLWTEPSGGGGEPAAYIKSASVSGRTLTMTKQDDTTVTYSAAPETNIVTSGTTITLADNTEYRLTNVTTLTLTYPSGDYACYFRIETAASGTVTITLPSSTYVGSAPSFGNGETWLMYIENGVVVAGKAGSGS